MSERGSRGDVFVAGSAALLILELLNIRRWLSASRLGGVHGHAVGGYLKALPMGLGRIGATQVTTLCIAGALLGAFLAHTARSRYAASKALTLGVLALHLAVATWLMFTLM